MLRLVSLFGMFTVLRDLGDFLEDGYLTGAMAAALREELYKVPLCHHQSFSMHATQPDVADMLTLALLEQALRPRISCIPGSWERPVCVGDCPCSTV